MNPLKSTALVLCFLLATLSITTAKAQVVEGLKASTKYNAEKDTAAILIQRKKKFYFQADGKKAVKKPKSITVKVGQPLFIINDEKKIMHNVFDESDSAWVLKKQTAGQRAYTTYLKPGVHKLRCAIHPKMKVTVNVVE